MKKTIKTRLFNEKFLNFAKEFKKLQFIHEKISFIPKKTPVFTRKTPVFTGKTLFYTQKTLFYTQKTQNNSHNLTKKSRKPIFVCKNLDEHRLSEESFNFFSEKNSLSLEKHSQNSIKSQKASKKSKKVTISPKNHLPIHSIKTKIPLTCFTSKKIIHCDNNTQSTYLQMFNKA